MCSLFKGYASCALCESYPIFTINVLVNHSHIQQLCSRWLWSHLCKEFKFFKSGNDPFELSWKYKGIRRNYSLWAVFNCHTVFKSRLLHMRWKALEKVKKLYHFDSMQITYHHKKSVLPLKITTTAIFHTIICMTLIRAILCWTTTLSCIYWFCW